MPQATDFEPAGPEPPLNLSLPDACTRRRTCLALHVREEGGMGALLGGLSFQWGLFAAGVVGGSFWAGSPALALVLTALAASFLAGALVIHRISGHRGWCCLLRALDLAEHLEAIGSLVRDLPLLLLAPVAGGARRLSRPLARLWRFLTGSW